MSLIAVHGGHNAAVSFFADGRYFNVELERLFRHRYFSLFEVSADELAGALGEVLHLAQRSWGIENDFDTCISMVLGDHEQALRNTVRARSYQKANHHESHAAAALYQSPFQEALVVSFDGGGNDGYFNVYRAQKGEELRRVAAFPMNVGTVYGLFGCPVREIRSADKTKVTLFLALAGKMMGLAAYGTVRPEWRAAFQRFYRTAHVISHLDELGESIGEDLGMDAVSGQKAYDIAATSQHVFEELALDCLVPLLDLVDLPLCLTGGCALNVLLNERLRKLTQNRIFVPPNPDDGGLAFGMLAEVTRPRAPICTTYSGLPILDVDRLEAAAKEHQATRYTLEELARLFKDGKIVGVMREDSEHGPRALGNRSILCDPSFPEMKDVLNARVKYREWFRPFAPVVREEDVAIYFDLDMPSPYMSFASKVKPEWIERIPAIVHVDGTARVQTVTAQQHAWLHELLGVWKRVSPHGVLLNTSFNIKGLPILTTIEDALHVLRSTEIDYVVIGPWLFSRRNV